MSSKISIIIAREFSERVVKKSFIFTTLLMPLLMVLLAIVPALILAFNTPTAKTIAVADRSGLLLPALQQAELPNLKFEAATGDLPAVGLLSDEHFDAVLDVDSALIAAPRLTLYSYQTIGVENEQAISRATRDFVEAQRLRAYNIDNLPEILESVKADVQLQTLRLDESGDQEETSSTTSFIIGMVMAFLLYMLLLIYGQIVMSSVIDEKSNRVLELVVTSVKPFQLMMGKVLGVGLVAVTQLAIWCVLLCSLSALVLPMFADSLASPEALQSMDMAPEEMSAILSVLQPGAILATFGYMMLFLVGGFLFYASIFAAIGSAVSNIQDAAQLQSIATVPIMLAFIVSITSGQDPMSSLSVVLSIVPLTSPIVMLTRIPYGVPTWQILTAVAALYLSFIFMAWLAGKIYRIGIFMYGRKPSLRDLVRWARYK